MIVYIVSDQWRDIHGVYANRRAAEKAAARLDRQLAGNCYITQRTVRQ